jgi:arsenite methyltransferase
MSMTTSTTAESATRDRYAAAAHAPEAALCCPVQYDPRFLTAIPAEVIEKDYGCGDPSAYVKTGETVLDLGSGTGKICFIAAQVVGPKGRVIGVDMTDDMLEVARRNAPVVAENIGYANVEFRKGRIQDLAATEPPIASDSIDVVVSNCVLNLVETPEKQQLFEEIFRVLRPGGRAVISDIVSDQEIPQHLQNDPVLWSGCISGAFVEDGFPEAFVAAGFADIELLKRDEEPWQTVEGIEFRSVTVRAWKSQEAQKFQNIPSLPTIRDSRILNGVGECCQPAPGGTSSC